MSLGIIIKGPEGLVLAAESRVTMTATPAGGTPIHVNFDNATKVLSFADPHNYVGVVTYGLAAIGLRTAHSFVPEFESQLPPQRLPIADFATRLRDFFKTQWDAQMPPTYNGPAMIFNVAGFNDGSPYGELYEFSSPFTAGPNRVDTSAQGDFRISWGGQREFVDRLIHGIDSGLLAGLRADLNLSQAQEQTLNNKLTAANMQIPLQAMALQDCVDLAIFFIRTTISAQQLTVGIRGCGGMIDVATVTRRDGLKFVQRKTIKV